ncbi:MAG: glycosyltransferase family 4 protein [Geminicoccaceae bacterium]
MRILAVMPDFPYPPVNGGQHRFAHLLRHLAASHEVWLVTPASPGRSAATTLGLPPFRRVWEVPASTRARGGWPSWLRSEPSESLALATPEMARAVAEAVGAGDPDLVLAGDPALARRLEPHRDRPIVLDYLCEVVLQSERMAALADVPQSWLWKLRGAKFARFLRRNEDLFDYCVLNSREDRASLARFWPQDKLTVVPNGLPLDDYPAGLAAPVPGRLIYPGSITYPPNRDAVEHFARAVLPLVQQQVPAVELWVTGAVPPTPPPLPPSVRLVGHVPDVRSTIASAWAAVVPLRLGAGGARFKMLECLALGTPVVATAIGYEGLEVLDGVDLLTAEKPEEFAAQTVRLLRSTELRQRLATRGRALMEQRYDWARLGRSYETMLAAVVESARLAGRATSDVAGRAMRRAVIAAAGK